MVGVGDFLKGVVGDVLTDLLKKTTGTGKRVRRRKGLTKSTAQPRTKTGRFKAKPAQKQTSRKRTVRNRSKVKRRA